MTDRQFALVAAAETLSIFVGGVLLGLGYSENGGDPSFPSHVSVKVGWGLALLTFTVLLECGVALRISCRSNEIDRQGLMEPEAEEN